MQKNGLLARTSYQIKPLRLKRPLDGLGHVVELPLRKHYNVFAEGCLLDLSPILVVEKTGPIEEQAIPSLKLSFSFAVRFILCTFSLFHVCFLAFGAADRSCPCSPCLSTVWVSRGFETKGWYALAWWGPDGTASPPPTRIDKERQRRS